MEPSLNSTWHANVWTYSFAADCLHVLSSMRQPPCTLCTCTSPPVMTNDSVLGVLAPLTASAAFLNTPAHNKFAITTVSGGIQTCLAFSCQRMPELNHPDTSLLDAEHPLIVHRVRGKCLKQFFIFQNEQPRGRQVRSHDCRSQMQVVPNEATTCTRYGSCNARAICNFAALHIIKAHCNIQYHCPNLGDAHLRGTSMSLAANT